MNESFDAKLSKALKRSKRKNLEQARSEATGFARKNKTARDTGGGMHRASVREVGMIPLSVFNLLPEEIQNDNDKLLEWLQTDEFGSYFRSVDKI